MTATVEQIIYSRLSGDSTLAGLAPGGVWRGVAPGGAAGTVVVFTQVSASDSYALAHRAYTTFTYQIKAITPGTSAAPAWAASQRVEALLTDAAIGFMECRRQTVISQTEIDGGEQYQHAGGLYRITTQE